MLLLFDTMAYLSTLSSGFVRAGLTILLTLKIQRSRLKKHVLIYEPKLVELRNRTKKCSPFLLSFR